MVAEHNSSLPCKITATVLPTEWYLELPDLSDDPLLYSYILSMCTSLLPSINMQQIDTFSRRKDRADSGNDLIYCIHISYWCYHTDTSRTCSPHYQSKANHTQWQVYVRRKATGEDTVSVNWSTPQTGLREHKY